MRFMFCTPAVWKDCSYGTGADRKPDQLYRQTMALSILEGTAPT